MDRTRRHAQLYASAEAVVSRQLCHESRHLIWLTRRNQPPKAEAEDQDHAPDRKNAGMQKKSPL
ncbi:hypothetical protein XFEB_02273 [Xylella fastidiosa EB92.1]|nr:hypothetical protein XFEB_02273 [Xylella fastidiosa EB92.1]